MRALLTLICCVSLLFVSCRKSISGDIAGTWKMVLVIDNITNASISKPSSVNKDVIITFIPNNASEGTFSGNTPTNQIGPSPYFLGPNNALSTSVLMMTKVGETNWGRQFVDNIIEAKYFRSKTRRLTIRATGKTLIFQRL